MIELKENVPTVLKSQMSGIFKLETRTSTLTTTSSNILDRNPVFGMVPITMPTETFDVVVKSFASTVAGTQNQANSENDLKLMEDVV